MPATTTPWVRATRSRDRRGRGLRAPLLPRTVPAWTTKSREFDSIVLEAYAPINNRWHTHLKELDIAIDDVPTVALATHLDIPSWPTDVTADGPVPLAHLVPVGVNNRGQRTRARIVLFRRPLELRVADNLELLTLIHEVLTEQTAHYLGIPKDKIDETES